MSTAIKHLLKTIQQLKPEDSTLLPVIQKQLCLVFMPITRNQVRDLFLSQLHERGEDLESPELMECWPQNNA